MGPAIGVPGVPGPDATAPAFGATARLTAAHVLTC